MKGILALPLIIGIINSYGFDDSQRKHGIDEYKYIRYNGKYAISKRTPFFGVSEWNLITDNDNNVITIDTEWDANKIVRKLNLGNW